MLHCLKRSSIGHPQTGRAVTMVHCVSCQGLDRFRKLGECWLLEVLTSDDNCSIMREHLNDIVRCDVSFCSTWSRGLAQYLHQTLFHFSVNVGSGGWTHLVVGITVVAGQWYSLHPIWACCNDMLWHFCHSDRPYLGPNPYWNIGASNL